MFKKNLRKDSFFSEFNGKKIDKYQKKVILDESKYLLVVAGAGSGKTFTIAAKVKYLIEKKGLLEKDILCLSFTNEAVNNLKNRIGYNVDVMTFHKLALNIIRENNYSFKISSDSLLEYIIDEYFKGILIHNKQELLLEYFNYKYKYNNIFQTNDYEILKLNILSIIKKIKCNNLKIKNLYAIKRNSLNFKEKILYFFALDILLIYMVELQSEDKIDFDDMIILAKRIIKNGGIIHHYRYIIIDEYQDISRIRFELITEILSKTKAHLICVGDDYQSIYGFSGSNLSFFVNFFVFFPHAKRIDIKNNYRNSYQLIKLTTSFILKNPYQLRKNMHATFLLKYPVVLVYYDNILETYNSLINYLYLENEKNLLVLSRYNKDLKSFSIIKNEFMNIKYMSVHMSKGLEYDNVILLNVSNEYLGFPSKIVNNHLIELIDNWNEEIAFAEERRLFYVALTRCKRRVYILVPKKNPSIFIEEIKSSCVELLLK